VSAGPGPAGVLRVDKPAGPTSHDMVARVRRALKTRKVGHTGTLDPFATGLLLICVGHYTRLSQFLTGQSKTYEATLRLGEETDSLDTEGSVVLTDASWGSLDAQAIEAAALDFVGELDQVPPAFSAKKQDGERAYARARRGETVVLDTVRIRVEDFRVTRVELPEVDFRCTCSSGTYVRALGRDLARALDTVGSLTALQRTAIGEVSVEGAVTDELLQSIAQARSEDAEADGTSVIPRGAWLDPVEALGFLDTLEVSADEAARLRMGQAIVREGDSEGAFVVAHQAGALVAVGRLGTGRFRPAKVFPE